MVKALQARELDYSMPVTKAAGILVALRSQELWQHVKAVRKGDIEGVHDMRVAAKRLRELLRVFLPALPKAARPCLDEVDALNDALGAVRDRDVTLLRLASLAEEAPSDAEALGRLSADIQHERAQHLRALQRAIREHRASGGTADALDQLAQALTSERVSRKSLAVGSFAHAAIVRRLTPVFADTADARDPDDLAGFHALRIRVKRLKYAIEPFVHVLPSEVADIYSRIAELQELMGLVHDDDVLADILAGPDDGNTPEADLSAAIGCLRENRMRGHGAAVALLDQMEADNLPQRLMDALD